MIFSIFYIQMAIFILIFGFLNISLKFKKNFNRAVL